MRYIKAKNLLPEDLIKIIQEYVDGEFLYIPRKNGEQKAWGENSGSRVLLEQRNREIYHKYAEGINIKELSVSYYLSEQSIRRIINQVKERLSNSTHK